MKTLYLVRDDYTKAFERLSNFSILSKNYIIQDLPFNKKLGSLNTFLKSKKQFIYPLFIGSSKIFNENLPPLPKSVVNAVNSDKGLVVFFYLNEGNFHTLNEFKCLEKWTINCNLKKDNTYFFCGNHNIRKLYNSYVDSGRIKDTINYYPATFFESCFWSTKQFKRRDVERIPFLKEKLRQSVFEKNLEKKSFYFNCLNRKPRNERVFLTTLIKSFVLTSQKTSLSIGDKNVLKGSYNLRDIPFKEHIKQPDELKKVQMFLKGSYESMKNKGYSLDFDDLLKPGSDVFTPNFYKSSFCSIVVETEHIDDIMFLSEKTFKPIIMLHPFFLIGNKNSLKFLKDMGYKTFDKWWDESYDTYDSIYDRTYHAFKEIKKICSFNKNILSLIIKDMESVLEHNFNHYFDNMRYVEEFTPILKILSDD